MESKYATMMSSDTLVGKSVVTQDGADLGDISALDVQLGDWKVSHIEIRLRRAKLEHLHLKRPLLRSQTIKVATSDIAGVSDNVVLKPTLATLEFTGGEPEPEAEGEQGEQGEQGDERRGGSKQSGQVDS